MKYNINNYKNKIIKIVSQTIDVDYKEPYKLDNASSSIGTGFFIKDNYIITCSHCVDDAKSIYIEIASEGQRKYKVELVGLCPYFDIALLKSTEYKSKEYFNLEDSDKAVSGIEVVAIGFPLGQNNIKITRGIISGRQDGDIQTDTPINPGNSGGPLLYKNKVVGIIKSIMTRSNNVGYAIPINKYNIIKKELYNKNEMLISRTPMSNLFIFNNTDDNILALNGAKSGVYINYIRTNKSVLKAGDILTSINKHKIDNFGFIKSKKLKEKINISEIIDKTKLGDKVDIEYVRNKKHLKQSFILNYNKCPIRKIYPRFEKIDYEILDGLVLTNISYNYLRKLNKDEELNMRLYKYFSYKNESESVIIISCIYPNTNLSNIDVLEEGDIIIKVNNIEVHTIEELRKAAVKYTIIKKKKYILLETELNEKVIIDVKEFVKIGNNTRNTFKYPETELYKKLVS